ncbi:MAG: phosphoesterase [Candidatus Nanopelagicus sp.]
MKTWIGSDFHWGHQNIMKFCPVTRAKYKDVVEMTELMIQEWNEIVEPEDTVYMLGDICFMPAQKATETVNRLNGNKILIEGNHDIKLLRDPAFRKCFKEIHQYLRLNYAGQLLIMCHYPFAEWDQMHRGSINFHGHLHGNTSGMEKYRSRDMGMDATGKIVMLMEDAIASALTGDIKSHH